MFKIFTKRLSDEELRMLVEMWDAMITNFERNNCPHDCNNGHCTHKRLCKSLYATQEYLCEKLIEREANGKG